MASAKGDDFMLTVTFDSNVIEKVLRPEAHADEENSPFFFRLRKAIDEKLISVHVADLYFTREQIPKAERLSRTINNTSNAVSIHQTSTPNGYVQLSISIGPSRKFGNVELDEYRRKTLEALKAVDGKVLKTYRLGDFICREIPPQMYCRSESRDETMRRIDECDRYISNQLFAGANALRELTGSKPTENPYMKLSGLSNSDKAFSKTVAEDADAMSIAAHYGYGIQLFCTEDRGVSAGTKSVMSPQNRLKLRNRFGIRFCNVKSLVKLMDMFCRNTTSSNH